MNAQQRFDQAMLAVNLLVVMRVVYRVIRAKRASQGQVPAHVSRLLILTAAFACLYAVSYVVIFTVGPEYRLAWSHVMITVSPFVWWFVWPALADTVVEFQKATAVTRQILQPQIDEAHRSVMDLVRKVDKVA